LVGVGFGSGRSKRKKLQGLLMIGLVMAALIAMPACGGSSSSGGGGGGTATPAGSYTVTITGTGTDTTATVQTAQVVLTVN
jgi:ABC-type glycerol-3-phosphate transport system substrate-binding protein